MRFRRLLAVPAAFGVAVAVTSAAWAAWTAATTATGETKAAHIGVSVNEGDGEFEFKGDLCKNMLPGDACSTSVTVKNTGTVSETYAVTLTDSKPDCYASTLDIKAALESGDAGHADAHADHDPNDSHKGTLTVTLRPDAPNSCQDAKNTTTLAVTASASASPRD